MGPIFIAILLLASLLSTQADDYEAEKQKLRQKGLDILAQCKDKVGASPQDLQAVKNKQLPTSKEGFCMIECVFTNGNVMKNGKLNVEGTLQTLNPALSKNPAMKKKVTHVLRTCEKEVGEGSSDKCETAKLIAQCFKKESK
ncbi:putative odorant binding protein [Trypoxylus dichotomus]